MSGANYIKNLCCDISDMDNPMCWGCYMVWYERESKKWEGEEYFMEGDVEQTYAQEQIRVYIKIILCGYLKIVF